MHTWFRNFRQTLGQRRPIRQPSRRSRVENVEDRCPLSNEFVQPALDSGIPGPAPPVDRSGATSQAAQRLRARILARNATEIKRTASLRSASPTLAPIIGHLAQELLGFTLLLVGIGLIFTLVLMPIGLPIALLGIALIAAPSD
jgi:hypothetical protein